MWQRTSSNQIKDIMENQPTMTETQLFNQSTVLKAACETLERKGIIEFDGYKRAGCKVKPSHAFKIAISPTTDVAEAICICIALICHLIELGCRDHLCELDKAIFQSLNGRRLDPMLGPWPNLPSLESDPELQARVLQRFISLERTGAV